MSKHTRLNNQSGLVSIVVALVIMGIMTLMSVSFAFLTRREQRQALDRQLSTQAFYAAETGINDAVSKLDTLGTNVTDCSDAEQDRIGTLAERQLDPASGVEYTCVLVNQLPSSLVYDTISENDSIIVRVRSPLTIDNLKFSWQDAAGEDAGGEFADSGGNFYLPQEKAIRDQAVSSFLNTASGAQTADFPNHIGVLRATIIPAQNVQSDTDLLNNSQTVFMYPDKNDNPGVAGAVEFRNANQLSREGVFGSGECNTGNNSASASYEEFPRFCNTEITNVGLRDVYVRLRAVYRPVSLTITATNSSGTQLELIGAQAVIDSTGKANDVLRRMQVRVPIQDNYYFPEFAVESANTICKLMTVSSFSGVDTIDPSEYLYSGGGPLSYGGGETNDQAKDTESCRLPTGGMPY